MADLLQQMLDALKHPLSEYTHAERWSTTVGSYTVAIRRQGVYHLAAVNLDFDTAAGLAAEFNKLVRSMKRLRGSST